MPDSSASLNSVEQLDDALSQPSEQAIETLRLVPGDIMVLGATGKIGPSLTRMLLRANAAAGVRRRITAVARFADPNARAVLEAAGAETIACDLLDERAVAALPESPNVFFLAGMKFGASQQAALTWAMNTHLPSLIARQFAQSRIVAYSTGTTYGWVDAATGGAPETASLNPVGEYAMSCLGRERIFEYFSARNRTPIALIRLFYACEPRYGVLVDIAEKVWLGDPVDVSMGWFNVIWQGDANALCIQALEHVHSPPLPINITGRETLSTRRTAELFGQLLGKTPKFTGQEQPGACLGNTDRMQYLFNPTLMPVATLMKWIAEWLRNGGPLLGKPTHFESRDGRY